MNYCNLALNYLSLRMEQMLMTDWKSFVFDAMTRNGISSDFTRRDIPVKRCK